MTNLVPLHIDKDTGRIVARGGVISGGGGGAASGYYHEQLIPASQWVIIHGQANAKIICQIYDTVDELILPDRIKIIDANTVQVDFGTLQAGAAHIMFFTPV